MGLPNDHSFARKLELTFNQRLEEMERKFKSETVELKQRVDLFTSKTDAALKTQSSRIDRVEIDNKVRLVLYATK